MLHYRPLVLLLRIIILLLSNDLVIAFSHLIPRQFDNIGNVDEFGQILTGIGDAITTGIDALDNFGTGQNFFTDEPGQKDTTITTIPTNPEAKNVPEQGFSEQNYDLLQPPEPPKAPIQNPPALSSQCDTSNIFSNDCGKVLDQLIFTTSCIKIDTDQRPTPTADTMNDAIRAALITMDPAVKTTRSEYCGILMFRARLTAEQSRQIARMPGVSHVSSDIYLVTSDGSQGNPQPQPGVTAPAIQRSRLRKRSLVTQQNAPAHLSFISTPPMSRSIMTDYLYRSPAGTGTVVFSFGNGVNTNHEEFQNNEITPEGFLSGDDEEFNPTMPDPIFTGSDGTCLASLVMGDTCGVSKKTKLKPVVIDPTVGSLISGIADVSNFLLNRRNPRPSFGSVALLNVAWFNTDQGTTDMCIKLIKFLMEKHNVVTVVPASIGTDGLGGPMTTYPAFVSYTSDLIAVGAVDTGGARYPWSPAAMGLVSAPGSALCASHEGGQVTTTTTHPSVAAAQAAGLAAYFLSLYPQLRYEGAPRAVKQFITRSAYARAPGGDVSIWNREGSSGPADGETLQ